MTETERFCGGGYQFPLSEGANLVVSPLDASTHVLPHHALALLNACRTFRTTEEHAREFYRNQREGHGRLDDMISELSSQLLPSVVAKLLNRRRRGEKGRGGETEPDPAALELIKNQLEELAAAGLLISDNDLLALAGAAGGASCRPGRITTLGVVTRDRAVSLRRCLESYISSCLSYGRANDFAVMDDSASAAAREQNKRALTALKKKLGVEISYAGLEEKTLFAAALTSYGDCPPEVIKFALLPEGDYGTSVGANRNALLLHTAGDLIFSADDDTVCRLTPSQNLSDRLALFSGADPTEFWFFGDRQAALQSSVCEERDLLALHEELIGASLGDSITAFREGPGLSVERANSQFFRSLRAGAGRVLLVFTGLLGDSGMYSPQGYFLLTGESRERFARSEPAYLSACTSREVLRAASHRTLSCDWWSTATALSLDNRDLLPPFMPVLRNEDGLYGATVKAVFEHGYFGHLPWAIFHAPDEHRSYGPPDMTKGAAGPRLCDLLGACLTCREFWPGLVSPEKRLRALGEHLMELGSLPLQDFEEFVRIQLLRSGSEYASRLEKQLRSYRGEPAYWAKGIEGYLAVWYETIRRERRITPRDLVEARGVEGARDLSRSLFYDFGRLLYWWPEVVEGAKRLRAAGRRLGAPV
jgi:hypothetical protein